MVSMRELTGLFGFLRKRESHPSVFLIENVPYYSQWESPDLVGAIIREEISARDDLLWKKSGAKSSEEYEFWANNMCGMACLKMVLEHKLNKNVPIVELGKECLRYGGYVLKPDTIDGLYYAPFVRFIKHEFDLDAKVVGRMSVDRIVRELAFGNYVIASVHHEIRSPDSSAFQKGGHLVLVLGYNLEENKLFFHNPSGDTPQNQSHATVSFSKFKKFFAGRGIVIKK